MLTRIEYHQKHLITGETLVTIKSVQINESTDKKAYTPEELQRLLNMALKYNEDYPNSNYPEIKAFYKPTREVSYV